MMEFLAAKAPLIALIGFFAAFVGIAAAVLRPSRRKEMDRHAQIPLKEPEDG